jgi:hypothetical protein
MGDSGQTEGLLLDLLGGILTLMGLIALVGEYRNFVENPPKPRGIQSGYAHPSDIRTFARDRDTIPGYETYLEANGMQYSVLANPEGGITLVPYETPRDSTEIQIRKGLESEISN